MIFWWPHSCGALIIVLKLQLMDQNALLPTLDSKHIPIQVGHFGSFGLQEYKLELSSLRLTISHPFSTFSSLPLTSLGFALTSHANVSSPPPLGSWRCLGLLFIPGEPSEVLKVSSCFKDGFAYEDNFMPWFFCPHASCEMLNWSCDFA